VRKLKLDLNDLVDVARSASETMQCFLDVETGRVLLVNEDIEYEVARVREALGPEPDWENIDREAVIQELDMPDWIREPVLDAFRIEAEYGGRYLPVPEVESRDGFRDMQAFISTIEDERLRDRLWRAIDGRKPFRRFKDVLCGYPDERERWFAFSNERVQERILEWLKEEGIEPAEEC